MPIRLTICPFRKTDPTVRDRTSEIRKPVSHWVVRSVRSRGGSMRTVWRSFRSSSRVRGLRPAMRESYVLQSFSSAALAAYVRDYPPSRPGGSAITSQTTGSFPWNGASAGCRTNLQNVGCSPFECQALSPERLVHDGDCPYINFHSLPPRVTATPASPFTCTPKSNPGSAFAPFPRTPPPATLISQKSPAACSPCNVGMIASG